MTRRDFIVGGVAGFALRAVGEPTALTDPHLSAFLSDIHVAAPGLQTPWGEQPSYQNGYFARAVDAVLAMRPRPARLVVFGDVALWFGFADDYATAKPQFDRLRAAGIEVVLTTGNHDCRQELFEAFPACASASPVAGRAVSVTDLGTADLILLDSLKERDDGKPGNAVEGTLDDAQYAWLSAEVVRRKRPFIVGAHHAPYDLSGRKLVQLLGEAPNCIGYVYGHVHKWSTDWRMASFSSRRLLPFVSLPSTGWWGDIGFVLCRTDETGVTLSIAPGNDFFFPNPLKPGEPKPELWRRIISEHANASFRFPFSEVGK